MSTKEFHFQLVRGRVLFHSMAGLCLPHCLFDPNLSLMDPIVVYKIVSFLPIVKGISTLIPLATIGC